MTSSPTRPGSARLHAFLAACGGFLLATLWFDLMFDVQVRPHPGAAPLPEAVLASIAGYYRRVTTDAHPMQMLIGFVMSATVLGTAWQLRASSHRGLRWASVVTAVVPIGLAVVRIYANAVALGGRAGSVAEQSALARSIYGEHALCFVSIAIFVAVQIRLARD